MAARSSSFIRLATCDDVNLEMYSYYFPSIAFRQNLIETPPYAVIFILIFRNCIPLCHGSVLRTTISLGYVVVPFLVFSSSGHLLVHGRSLSSISNCVYLLSYLLTYLLALIYFLQQCRMHVSVTFRFTTVA